MPSGSSVHMAICLYATRDSLDGVHSRFQSPFALFSCHRRHARRGFYFFVFVFEVFSAVYR